MVDPEAGYIQRDGLLLACEVVDCQPWFDFADLEVFVSDSEAESLSTDPEEILDSDDSDVLTPEEEDTFRQVMDSGQSLDFAFVNLSSASSRPCKHFYIDNQYGTQMLSVKFSSCTILREVHVSNASLWKISKSYTC